MITDASEPADADTKLSNVYARAQALGRADTYSPAQGTQRSPVRVDTF